MTNLAWAIYYGRQGAVIDYDWDFSDGLLKDDPERLVPSTRRYFTF